VNAPLNPEQLPDDIATLKKVITELLGELRDQKRRGEQLQHTLDQLRRMHFGPKSEQVVREQILLPFVAAVSEQKQLPTNLPNPAAAAAAPKPKETPVNGHGRRPLPAHLKREPVVHDLPAQDRVCGCCKAELVPIGEEVTEQLDYRPGSLHVSQHRRKKYACKSCQKTVVTAELPPQPIEKGLPGPGLLAQVLTAKYADHLPLNRQEKIFQREGVQITRSTMADWVRFVVEILGPVYEAMRQDVMASKKLHTDDIPVPVLDETREHTREARLWCHVGDEQHHQIVYNYTPTHEAQPARDFLAPFQGYLQADAYKGYDKLFQTGRVIEVACWAHARRYFFDAKNSDEARAMVALAYIGQLYDVEHAAKDLTADQRKAMRQERSRPVLDGFKKWLEQEGMRVLPKSPLGEAFQYAQGQWKALTRYLEDGTLDIDNNIAERAIRGIAVGRKNWLFAGSDEGGKRAAVVYSLIESCKLNKIDPFAYLRDVISRIATHPAKAIAELMPRCWKPPPVAVQI
jgi:transposase